MLSLGSDIAVTHTTFLNATPETLELIEWGNYTIIIDEALDVVTSFNDVQTVENTPKQKVTPSDIKLLLENKIIKIEQNNKVVWLDKEYDGECKFSEVQRFAKLGRLYCVDNQFLITVFPPEMFKCFNEVYILTYMFTGSTFKYYLDLFNIDYELKSVKEDILYELTDYNRESDRKFRAKCKELITICDNEKMNGYKSNALSKSWYDNSRNNDRLGFLQKNVKNYYRNILKVNASSGGIMWTCYGAYEDKIRGNGYTRERRLTDDEKKLPKPEQEKILKQLTCFVPCNSKATNIYSNRWALAYCINIFFHPKIKNFFTENNKDRVQNGLSEIRPDADLYALSCLIQWIFRSRIRNGKPINIYIPSTRMRNLLIDWLNSEI